MLLSLIMLKYILTRKSSCVNARAYRLPCSKYSLCCPNWVPPQPGYPPVGHPLARVPPARVPPWPGYPPGWTWQGTPPARDPPGWTWQGTPPAGPGRVPPWPGYPPGLDLAVYPPWLDLAGYPPWLPHGILGNVAKHCGIWVPPLWTDRLMDRRVSKHYLPVVLRTRAVKRKIDENYIPSFQVKFTKHPVWYEYLHPPINHHM